MTTSALESGAICAVAGQGQRQMSEWAAEYPGLYGSKAFDPALFSTLALAAAFSGPGLDAERLRMANRVCLWCFGLDWLIDYAATSADEVRDLVRRCKEVAAPPTLVAAPPTAVAAPPAAHAAPSSSVATPPPAPTSAVAELTAFLSDIRTELSAAPAFTHLGDVWLCELSLMLDAMAREWEWKAARETGATGGPTFDSYLANADNLGFSFVLTSHWIAGGGQGEIDAVREAARAVQRVIRLLNDLGTYERDLQWGDLNALLLDLTRSEVEGRIADLTAEARTAIHNMRNGNRGLATYLERQMDFCAGFYGVTDFWGAL